MRSKNIIADREDDYKKQRRNRMISPERVDAFAEGGSGSSGRSYRDIMKEQQLLKEENKVRAQIQKKLEQEEQEKKLEKKTEKVGRKRRRWDATPQDVVVEKALSEWDEPETPVKAIPEPGATPVSSSRRNRWDETPTRPSTDDDESQWDNVGSAPKKTRSRWDETPEAVDVSQTPAATPVGNLGQMTPSLVQAVGLTPEHLKALRWQRQIDVRNRPLSDEELDEMLPGAKEGYKILQPPDSYVI